MEQTGEGSIKMLNIAYSMLSKPGDRLVNEDFLDVSVAPERLAFLLCDGLGGHGNGDIASRFVTEQMKNALEQSLDRKSVV